MQKLPFSGIIFLSFFFTICLFPLEIPNGSMNQPLTDWRTENQATLIRDTTIFKEGPASLCLESKDPSNKDCKAVLSLAIERQESFQFQGFYRVEGESLENGVLGLLFFDSDWKVVGEWQHVLTILPGRKDWEAFQKDVTVPAGAARLLIILALNGKGKVWLDELKAINIATETFSLPQEDIKQYQGPIPKIRNVGLIHPAILCVELREFEIEWGRLEPYQRQEGDEIRNTKVRNDGVIMERELYRQGKKIGRIVGPENKLHLQIPDRVTGRPLDRSLALKPQTWSLVDSQKQVIKPKKIDLKQKPLNRAGVQMRDNWYFLTFEKPLQVGETYRLDLGQYDLQFEFICDPRSMRSEAIHVSHIGYRPDDPVKYAFLSCWMGTGGGVQYSEDLKFSLLEEKTKKEVFTKNVTLWMPKQKASFGYHAKGRNYALTDVYLCDFSEFSQPGSYVLYIHGIGISFPFPIQQEAWLTAAKCSLRGFFHQRAGQEWRQPWADWNQPRAFHPDDGEVFWELSKSRLDIEIELNKAHEDVMETGLFDQWKTGKIIPNAWGGYYDAGDYDRHTEHLGCSRYMLELLELFPDFWKRVSLPIPEEKNHLPDLLDEALWGIDLYRRMQREDGAIYGGVETNGHPKPDEPPFLNSLTCYVFAPDPRSTWDYVSAAAYACYVLKKLGFNQEATIYQESALRAMAWAEKEYQSRTSYFEKHRSWWRIKDKRNLAALMLYQITEEKRWHDLFLATCIFNNNQKIFQWGQGVQVDAAFIYARLPDRLVDPTVKKQALLGLEELAQNHITYSNGIPFMWSAPKGDPGFPLILSINAAPQGIELCRAYFLTGKKEYLAYAVRTSLFSVGANPQNMTFTTGLGYRSPEFPLQCTRWAMHTPKPYSGFTVYGLFAMEPPPQWIRQWFVTQYNSAPDMNRWPIEESYWDVASWPMVNENTIWQSMAPALYVWGFLSARP